jgi:hypothetical protein
VQVRLLLPRPLLCRGKLTGSPRVAPKVGRFDSGARHIQSRENCMTRHPASGGGRYDIPDVADHTASEAQDQQVQSYEHAQLDYSDADIPDVAGDTAEYADLHEFQRAQSDFDGEKH